MNGTGKSQIEPQLRWRLSRLEGASPERWQSPIAGNNRVSESAKSGIEARLEPMLGHIWGIVNGEVILTLSGVTFELSCRGHEVRLLPIVGCTVHTIKPCC